VRYTGTSLAFNFAGIVGAALAPSIATSLASHYGIAYVGYYLSSAGLVTLAALLVIGRLPGRPLSARPKRSRSTSEPECPHPSRPSDARLP
jgi:fucose permease